MNRYLIFIKKFIIVVFNVIVIAVVITAIICTRSADFDFEKHFHELSKRVLVSFAFHGVFVD